MDPLKKMLKLLPRVVINVGILVVGCYLVYTATTYAFSQAKDIAAATQPEDKSAKEVVVTVPEGSSTPEIANLLHDKGLIESAQWFRIASKLENTDGLYKAGKYSLNTSMTEEELMEKLVKGAASEEDMLKITIPEGYTAAQIAQYLAENGFCTEDEFRTAMNEGEYDYDFVKALPSDRGARLEGYLFPDTYFVAKGSTSEEIISKMLSRFEQVYKEEEKTKTINGLTTDEIVTRASIIEGEIRVPEERAACASVIQNRLDSDMPLQMCSTIMYGLGKRKEKLLLTDLEIVSPYNTYKNPGLPVGPIGNPGRAALQAVFSPADTDFLYFVVKDEEAGTHEWTANYNTFVGAKAEYKQKF